MCVCVCESKCEPFPTQWSPSLALGALWTHGYITEGKQPLDDEGDLVVGTGGKEVIRVCVCVLSGVLWKALWTVKA